MIDVENLVQSQMSCYQRFKKIATIAQDAVPHLPKDRILGNGSNILGKQFK